MDKLPQTGVKINTNLVWTSHNIGVLNLTPEFLNVHVSNTPLRHRFLELKGNYVGATILTCYGKGKDHLIICSTSNQASILPINHLNPKIFLLGLEICIFYQFKSPIKIKVN